ncbi:glycine cleavage T- (aminomethyl transferase) domain containing protein [Babesia ovis]|uniref:Glycine cleavage T- (Aminomethyl transferase) domain containing protein n=1 Tax=Babesia ovis TaxID=5869 RepID=A0A9W5TDQ0_BABOV|nr:glycine cleavage T- (aminomethyl transferase) domain containing protein [Babesia ovis]
MQHCDECEDLYQLADEYLDMEHDLRAFSPSQDTIVQQKISQLLQQRFNYNPVANMQLDPQAGSEQEVVDQPGTTQVRSPSVVGVASDDDQKVVTSFENTAFKNGTVVKVDLAALGTAKTDTLDIFHMLDTRVDVELLKLWTTEDVIEAIYYNGGIMPLVVDDAEREYLHIRNKTSLIDKSYQLPIVVKGEHAADFLEHFVTSPVKQMVTGVVQYSALLDTKGTIMDMAYIARYDQEYLVVTNGLNKRNLYDYMSAYMVTCRRAGMDITLEPLVSSSVITIQGPMAAEVLKSLEYSGGQSGTPDAQYSGEAFEPHNVHLAVPDTLPEFMQCFGCSMTYETAGHEVKTETIRCMRISDVGEDGFEFVASSEAINVLARMLLKHPQVCATGFKAYDSARMEAGIIRSDLDLPTEASPIQAAVAWSVDTKKLRYGTLFGKKHMTAQLINGVAKVRVGLVSNEKLDIHCNILKQDTRKPIGFVTSCAWSYGLGMYLSQAYVNTENARHDMPVYISLPLKPQAPVTKKEFRKYYRNRTKRIFIRGTLVRLPFVLHNYAIKQEHRLYVGGRNVPLQTLGKQLQQKHDHGEKTVTDQTDHELQNSANGNHSMGQQELSTTHENGTGSKTGIKTRKQLWKEIVAKQRSKNAKTLELAIKQLERSKISPYVEQTQPEGQETENVPLHIDRINIAPRAEIPLERVIEHYREIHNQAVPSRHRRYRPLIMPIGVVQTNV